MLRSVFLQQFRCFTQFQTDLHPRFNFISGENGSGKTAFLEAIALLSQGQSFRMREMSPLIQFGQSQCALMAHLIDAQTVGIQKTQAGETTVRINSRPCSRRSELVSLMPSQVIYQDIFQIIDAGPVMRRQLLDWGMFHVKPSYHEQWQQYRQALKQRNALLKQRAPLSAFAAWNFVLGELAEQLNEAREVYLEALRPLFYRLLQQLTTVTCTLNFYKGWDRTGKHTLEVILETAHAADCMKQYTQYGPHHADLELVTCEGQVRKVFSRGQQKIVLLALKLAQAELLNKPCLYIWDDICSELDHRHLEKLTEVMEGLPGQYFISGIDLKNSRLVTRHSGKLIPLG